MKVLVLSRHPSGGIRTYFRYVYGHSSMSDVSLTFMNPETDAMAPIVASLGNVSEVVVAGNSTKSLFTNLLQYLKRSKPDLIHSHGFTAAILASVPARLLGIKHIATTHDVFLPGQFPGPSGMLKRWVIGKVLALCTVINPVGEDARANLEQTYPALAKRNKVRAIRNGIETNAFMIDECRNLRDEATVPEQAILVGFFGRFMAQKGFGLLVDAVEQWNRGTPNRPLHVACFGWGGFIREEQASISARGLSEYFHFFSGTDEMAKALRGVDAVVMPSRWEACPLLPMEAMVAGTPVIGSRCIGMNEVTSNTPALLFDVNSVSGLLDNLKRFERESVEIKAQAATFREEASSRFDVGQTAISLRELYQRVGELPGLLSPMQ